MTEAAGPAGLLTFGETMGLVTADGIGTLDFAHGCRFGIGGAESNVAIAAARLGAPVTWIGRVGNDATGDLIARRLGAEPLTAVVIRDPSFTGLMVRHARAAGRFHVDYHRAGSAGSRLTAADIPESLLRGAGIVHLTGITPALGPSARHATYHSVEVAGAANVPVSLDVNYRRKLWARDEARPVLRDLVTRADIVFAGIPEAQLVLDTDSTDTERLAGGLTELGPVEAIIKNGAYGCTAVIRGALLRQPGAPVVVVDPVGAGDAFVAGYLADRLDRASPAQRLETAVAMGAFAVSVPGDCELLPTRDELQALMSCDDVVR